MSFVAPLRFDTYYHIYLGSTNQTTLFSSHADFHLFLQLYADLISPLAETFAYCLLPNHFHFFLRTKGVQEQIADWYAGKGGFERGGSVSAEFHPRHPDRQFARLLATYASQTQRHAPFANAPINRVPLTNPDHFPDLVRYIHQNPSYHQQVPNFRNYHWSSYRSLLSSQPSRIAVKTVLAWFHSPEWFDEMHWVPVDETKIGYLILQD